MTTSILFTVYVTLFSYASPKLIPWPAPQHPAPSNVKTSAVSINSFVLSVTFIFISPLIIHYFKGKSG